jgi:hypothetical protein
MNGLEKRELGEEGRSYLSEVLKYGHSLCQKLRRLPLEKGRLVAYLPTAVKAGVFDSIRHFSAMSLGSENHVLVRNQFLTIVRQFLLESPDRVWIFEDSQGTVEYARKRPDLMTDEWNFHGEEVYIFVTQDDMSDEAILSAASISPPWRFIVCGTSVPEGLALPKPFEEISSELLEAFASRTESIISCAYDDVAYIYWDREESEAR